MSLSSSGVFKQMLEDHFSGTLVSEEVDRHSWKTVSDRVREPVCTRGRYLLRAHPCKKVEGRWESVTLLVLMTFQLNTHTS